MHFVSLFIICEAELDRIYTVLLVNNKNVYLFDITIINNIVETPRSKSSSGLTNGSLMLLLGSKSVTTKSIIETSRKCLSLKRKR